MPQRRPELILSQKISSIRYLEVPMDGFKVCGGQVFDEERRIMFPPSKQRICSGSIPRVTQGKSVTSSRVVESGTCGDGASGG